MHVRVEDRHVQVHVEPVSAVVQVAADARVARVPDQLAPRVLALTVDLYSDAWSNLKGVMVQGPTKLVGKGPRFRRIRNLLYRKYPQYPHYSAIGDADSVIVELAPKHAFSWGVE